VTPKNVDGVPLLPLVFAGANPAPVPPVPTLKGIAAGKDNGTEELNTYPPAPPPPPW
jgi:hypothetical protein